MTPIKPRLGGAFHVKRALHESVAAPVPNGDGCAKTHLFRARLPHMILVCSGLNKPIGPQSVRELACSAYPEPT